MAIVVALVIGQLIVMSLTVYLTSPVRDQERIRATGDFFWLAVIACDMVHLSSVLCLDTVGLDTGRSSGL